MRENPKMQGMTYVEPELLRKAIGSSLAVKHFRWAHHYSEDFPMRIAVSGAPITKQDELMLKTGLLAIGQQDDDDDEDIEEEVDHSPSLSNVRDNVLSIGSGIKRIAWSAMVRLGVARFDVDSIIVQIQRLANLAGDALVNGVCRVYELIVQFYQYVTTLLANEKQTEVRAAEMARRQFEACRGILRRLPGIAVRALRWIIGLVEKAARMFSKLISEAMGYVSSLFTGVMQRFFDSASKNEAVLTVTESLLRVALLALSAASIVTDNAITPAIRFLDGLLDDAADVLAFAVGRVVSAISTASRTVGLTGLLSNIATVVKNAEIWKQIFGGIAWFRQTSFWTVVTTVVRWMAQVFKFVKSKISELVFYISSSLGGKIFEILDYLYPENMHMSLPVPLEEIFWAEENFLTHKSVEDIWDPGAIERLREAKHQLQARSDQLEKEYKKRLKKHGTLKNMWNQFKAAIRLSGKVSHGFVRGEDIVLDEDDVRAIDNVAYFPLKRDRPMFREAVLDYFEAFYYAVTISSDEMLEPSFVPEEPSIGSKQQHKFVGNNGDGDKDPAAPRGARVRTVVLRTGTSTGTAPRRVSTRRLSDAVKRQTVEVKKKVKKGEGPSVTPPSVPESASARARRVAKKTLETALWIADTTTTGLDAERIKKLRTPKNKTERKWAEQQRRAMRWAALTGAVFVGVGWGGYQLWNFLATWRRELFERTKAVNTWRPEHFEFERAWQHTHGNKTFPHGGMNANSVQNWITTGWSPQKARLFRSTSEDLLKDKDFGYWFQQQAAIPFGGKNKVITDVVGTVKQLDILITSSANELTDVMQNIRQVNWAVQAAQRSWTTLGGLFFGEEMAALTVWGNLTWWMNAVFGTLLPVWMLFWTGYAVGLLVYHFWKGDPSEAMPQATRVIYRNIILGAFQLAAMQVEKLGPIFGLQREIKKSVWRGTVGRIAETAIAQGLIQWGTPILIGVARAVLRV